MRCIQGVTEAWTSQIFREAFSERPRLGEWVVTASLVANDQDQKTDWVGWCRPIVVGPGILPSGCHEIFGINFDPVVPALTVVDFATANGVIEAFTEGLR